MPILVHVDDLEPGMCLASNIINRFSVLLPHGHTISEKDIASLKRLTPDSMIQVVDPLLDQIVEFQDDSHDQNVSRVVRKNVASVIGKVGSNIRSGVHLTRENIAGMQKVIHEMLQYLQDNPVTMAVIEQSSGWDDYLQQHSAGVFYLSLVIGNTIRNYIKGERERLSSAKSIYNAMNLAPLATAALFHDIGMVPLEHIYSKDEPLTDEEKEMIRAHPITGAEMLPDQIHPMAKKTIREHHENQNGTGYPNSLPGEKISIFARIIRIADAYSAAISQKVYQQAKSPASVLYEMLYGRFRSCYDPVILKVFTSIVPPFPIGAKVQLQNDFWAVVVEHNHRSPFKPQVIVAFDQWGDPLPEEQINAPVPLGSTDDLRIKSFAGEDLSFLNNLESDDSDPLADAPLEQTFSELLDFALP